MIERRKMRLERIMDFIPLYTLLVVLLLSLLLISLFSADPGESVSQFFFGPFLSPYQFGNMLNTASVLMWTGLGISMAFRAGTFNLGGEGQIYAGALGATLFCLAFPALPGPLGILGAFLTALFLGGLLAAISGLFRRLWGVDELITSFLFSSAIIPVIHYLIAGPLRDPRGFLLSTEKIAGHFRLPLLLLPSKLNISLFFALVAAGLAALWLFSSVKGYELRLCGRNREFARYGGILTGAYILWPMALSGALHGIGGASLVLGTQYMSIQGFTAGFGWNGIAVALIARNNPILVIPSALVFGYLDAAVDTAMLHTDFSFELSWIILAVVFIFITVGRKKLA